MRINSRIVALIMWGRWIVCVVGVVALWACNAPKLLPPSEPPSEVIHRTFVQSLNKQLDLLFMIDDSGSMEGSQAKLQRQLPDFMKALATVPDLDLHLAVISSSLGAGTFSCPGKHPDDDGKFQFVNNCPALRAGERFIQAGPGGNNFTGAIGDLFGCVALLGADGCGFEQQFASTRLALERASNANDANNGGFLRPDALLGIVMLTNEDDCSVPFDSTLFDSSQTTLNSPLGGYQSYRCNEFGHLCDGVAPPHSVIGPTTLRNCVSAEGQGRLTSVASFVKFLKDLKQGDTKKIFVAALTGQPTPYVVDMVRNPNNGELQPAVMHSCFGSVPTENADPAIRIKTWIDAFGENGVLESICQDDYGTSMRRIAAALSKALLPACIAGQILDRRDNGGPDCVVTEVVNQDVAHGTNVPFCAGGADFPCWKLSDDGRCPGQKVLQLCREATCDATKIPSDPRQVEVTCSVAP